MKMKLAAVAEKPLPPVKSVNPSVLINQGLIVNSPNTTSYSVSQQTTKPAAIWENQTTVFTYTSPITGT